MAAQGKTTAVHFSLIFFVMLSVILGVVAYLFYTDYRDQNAAFVKTQTEIGTRDAANKRYQEEIEGLKKVIGVQATEIGIINPDDKSVIGQANAVIKTLAKNPADPTLVGALRDLRSEVDKQSVEMVERQGTIAELQRTVQALKGQYDTVVATHDDKRKQTETDLAGEQGKFEEEVAARERTANELQQQRNALQTELAQVKEQKDQRIRELQTQVTEYTGTNTRLREELERVKGKSFEIKDGEVVRVDQTGRTVYINLGEKDGLRKRTAFSVYQEHNSGIGRDTTAGGRAEDIKGSIEVINILSGNLAEARILSDNPNNPISPGDLIYTPLWSPGRVEQFAFVGMIDMDGDGNYRGDRERLHETLRAVDAKISSEVLDNGERTGGTINEQTKFLVIAAIPDLAKESDATKKGEIQKMMEARKEMQDEANRNAVPVINLGQFLNFIGFVPQRRLYVPGDGAPFRLQAGARSSGVSDSPTSSSRNSSGNTSALFGTRRRANPESGGSTSQVFGGRGTGTGY